MRANMPLNDPGSLDDATSTAISDYIRAANGLPSEAAPGLNSSAPIAAGGSPDQGEMAGFGPVKAEEDATTRASRDRLAALARGLTPVSDADLANPPAQDWLAWRRTSSTHGFSPLAQIDRSNVGHLGLAWSLALGTGTNGVVPLVRDGVMFINSNGTVQALDARDGDRIWSYVRPATTKRVPLSQPRGMALHGTTLYVPTIDNHMIALDARTGKVVWDHVIDASGELQLTASPLIAGDKIIQGVAGCQGAGYAGGCFIVALDAVTGKEAWRFHTIAQPGTPGGDSWNGAGPDQRFGGSVWVTGSYDAELGLVFFGTGQTYIVSPLLKKGPGAAKGSRDALFTDSTLAIDPKTGKLVWHYQHTNGDVWDLDWAFERTVVMLDTPKGPRKAVLTVGKTGIIDALDARTGQYLWSYDLGFQTLVKAIDPRTGRKTNDPSVVPEYDKLKLICPSTLGVRNWPSTAYDPSRGLLYLPMTPNSCMSLGLAANSPNVRGFGEFTQERRVAPNSDGNFGRVAAFDVKARKVVWANPYRAPQSSAVLATAGGVLFEGGRDRWFRALDAASGQSLWQTRLEATPNAYPITYMVDDKQYVAVVSGGGSPTDLFLAPLTPEFPSSIGGKTLMVFALPEPSAR
ncbi:PQQ-binding-like beta-propeller repeat protein [Novosphingobium sp. KCTC 2891]|nr:PQQ-binding-like beta-propeller repeat protein [Novosphingobium sp. KCTC 2891]MCW1383618.1 PQQ-binding-like beta-propeller repeat protein [Novosphingobium sp. KCTC 2891]